MPHSIASDPMPGNIVRVRVPHSVFHNIEKMQAVTRNVLGELGCQGCHSGYDIRFIQETEFSVNADLQVTSVGG
jgi:hypothetical protein